MRVLLDTNVILDRFHRRQPWYTEAAAFWEKVRTGQITGFITASSVTDIWYISRRLANLQVARSTVRDCLIAFQICTVDRDTLLRALTLPGSDYEDNLQIVCARAASLDAIVTRDPAGFQAVPMPVLSPVEATRRAD